MHFFVKMFVEGGIFMYVVLALGLLHAIPVLVQLFTSRKADFSGYLWAGLLGIVLVGCLGSVLGGIQMFTALEYAGPDQIYGLWARGSAIALYPTLLAVMLVIPGAWFTGLAATLARNLAPKRALKPEGEV